MRKSIAPKTEVTYATGINTFRAWRREERGMANYDSPFTADEICTYISWLADRGQHAASTIRVYLNALRHWHFLNLHPDCPPHAAICPTQSWSVQQTLTGIANAQGERKVKRAAAGVEPPANSPPLMYPDLMEFHFSPDIAEDRKRKAAAHLGVTGGLRPGELLGSTTKGEEHRGLHRHQLTFFADDAGTVPMLSPGTGEIPRVLQLKLFATKTKQFVPTIKVINAPAAVEAVWIWYQETAPAGPFAPLFPGLSHYALTQDLGRRYANAGKGQIKYSGKSLRRGGASTLAIQGCDPADISAIGSWSSPNMWATYANDPQVIRQRAIQRGSLMQPAAAAGGSIPLRK